MTPDVLVCQRSDSCGDVAERMRQGNVGILPVMDGREMVGVVTDRDLALRHVASSNRGAVHRDVGSCMTPAVVSVESGTTAEEAVQAMREHGVRRLLVIDDGTLQGIVTLDDIYLAQTAPVDTQHVIAAALMGTRGSARP